MGDPVLTVLLWTAAGLHIGHETYIALREPFPWQWFQGHVKARAVVLSVAAACAGQPCCCWITSAVAPALPSGSLRSSSGDVPTSPIETSPKQPLCDGWDGFSVPGTGQRRRHEPDAVDGDDMTAQRHCPE
jgi:hypothetical protein